MKLFIYTTIALTAFAANSLLCRLALSRSTIDAASFTSIRLAAGALILLLITFGVRPRLELREIPKKPISAALLFLYAAAFSLAYLSLSAATGALILFGSVQATMMIAALISGERPRVIEWVGLIIAVCGLIYLLLPGLTAPSPVGAALMISAGAAWGFYTLRGRKASNPLAETAGNFFLSLPFTAAFSLIFLLFASWHATAEGALLAVASGALASGLGYVVWYAALRNLTPLRAAVLQLFVPVLAALGGIIFLAENLSLRLVIAGLMILGGIAIAIWGKSK